MLSQQPYQSLPLAHICLIPFENVSAKDPYRIISLSRQPSDSLVEQEGGRAWSSLPLNPGARAVCIVIAIVPDCYPSKSILAPPGTPSIGSSILRWTVDHLFWASGNCVHLGDKICHANAVWTTNLSPSCSPAAWVGCAHDPSWQHPLVATVSGETPCIKVMHKWHWRIVRGRHERGCLTISPQTGAKTIKTRYCI